MQQLPGLAYGNISLATGGAAAYVRRCEAADRAIDAQQRAERAAANARINASNLSEADKRELRFMLVTQEIKPSEVQSWIDGLLSAYPWYAR